MHYERSPFPNKKTAKEFRAKLLRWFIKKKLHDFSKKFRGENLPIMACFSNDFISNAIFVDGLYEREDLEAITAFLKAQHPEAFSGTFVDVGANIGNHTVFFSKSFDDIVSIEPHPRTFLLLRFNADFIGSRCLNVGVSDRTGEMKMLHPANINSGRATLSTEGGKGDFNVRVDTLDNLLANQPKVSLIKVDVEGMEAQVFRGAQDCSDWCRMKRVCGKIEFWALAFF